jgi:hypothetical protein
MRNLAKHRQAANHIPSTRSGQLRKLHHTQRILAKDALNMILSDDMPDNEEEEVESAKRRHLKWSSPAWLTCLSSIQHEMTGAFPHDWWSSWFC